MRASDLTRLMAVLAKGDVLVITWFDRLARSTRDLLNLLGTIAEKGAGFKSLRDTNRGSALFVTRR
jgi:DNA invertase Pin-like site-specific DNA recombinase